MDSRARVIALLRKHGWNATSFQVLERGYRYWFDENDAHEDVACVAYVEVGGAWVVAGGPIAPASAVGEVTRRFVAAARAAGRRVSFFATEARFAQLAAVELLHVGEQPVWDPRRWDEGTNRNLKEQLRRARVKGVTVRQLAASEVAVGRPLRHAIEQLISRWLDSRAMAPLGFLVDVQPFEFPDEHLYLVAEQGGQVVGFLAAVPVFERDGWFFEDLVRDPRAPNGTAELLVDAGMRVAAHQGKAYVTLGLAPLAGPVGSVLSTIRDASRALYDFDGLLAFKAKLKPDAWDPIYLAYPHEAGGTVALYDVLGAFARGSFARFGWQSLLRGPAFVVRLLAALLVPWTVVLALADARWFPSPAIKYGWIGFDLVVALCLFLLAHRWRPTLGAIIAVAITGDAALTAVEILIYNARHVRGPLDALVLLIAWLAPTLAALVLWGAVRQRD